MLAIANEKQTGFPPLIDMAKISVVIPAYNAELHLRATLQSVLAQTVQPYEIIVVNDGSTDRTEEIALTFGSSIRYIKQENQGLASARNAGIYTAAGDWIALLDSDDLMTPEKLSKQIALIDATPSLVLVYSAFTFLYSDGSTEEAAVFPANKLWPALRYRSPILPSTSMIRRSALLEIGGFNTLPTEDWDLWFRLIRRYSAKAFQEIPESLLLYRQWENNLSKRHMYMARGGMQMLDTLLLEGLSGFRKSIWKRRIEAKIYYKVAVVMRELKDDRYWSFAIASFLSWPLCGRIVPFHRYLVIANMLYRRLKGFRFNYRYWWPVRTCRENLRTSG
jgi:glycosyltransferase involved in cell wall biosynthesis